ncbi:hypothetical protein B0T16DRAFT_388891 [Cercophora newfieldiana]|uniref:F-box domain-containing protein n=1 Tax=Cercophora newfieldiana TaxID=92897 RepID=A0AA40CTQ6_9PEZI|nr:hypothetical protein B0T16DRAFT_388891 [Cercophora newfieldiana]
MSWNKFPTEIRLMILELVRPSPTDTFQPENKHLQSRYTRVCKEWQHFFEPGIFRQLFIRKDRISDLDKVTSRVPRRQHLVQETHLRIMLPEYNLKVSQPNQMTGSQARRRNAVFTKAIRSAQIWEKGIALSISTYSPSDCQHGFRDFDPQDGQPIWFTTDALANKALDFPVQRARAAQGTSQTPNDNSPGDQEQITKALTIQGGNFHKVPLVQSLSHSRQSCRAISSSTLNKLLRAFPNLHTLVHERWVDATTELQKAFAGGDGQPYCPEYFVGLSKAIDPTEPLDIEPDMSLQQQTVCGSKAGPTDSGYASAARWAGPQGVVHDVLANDGTQTSYPWTPTGTYGVFVKTPVCRQTYLGAAKLAKKRREGRGNALPKYHFFTQDIQLGEQHCSLQRVEPAIETDANTVKLVVASPVQSQRT